ncbi:hypothetical protein SDC9_163663 [bioreactor metagenome]|uniref:Uncharacterized protein n=1 Tax=bioreactor metagenome TaxID=1076179 RepID=A0A645FWD4_9ZZZZ
MGVGVYQHGAVVHFRPGRRKGGNGDDGQAAADQRGIDNHVPGRAGVIHAGGDALGGVDAAAAADGDDNLHTLAAAKPDAFVHRLNSGIWEDAGKLAMGNSALLQALHGLLGNPVLLNAAAAINQESLLSPLKGQRAQSLKLALPEEYGGWNRVTKILHNIAPFKFSAWYDRRPRPPGPQARRFPPRALQSASERRPRRKLPSPPASALRCPAGP